ncbi:MAG TPA: DEAD/DEAH box helicase [Xanthomonadaceae bacterium]|nr:DEAD/DEAH box helicase [Xanthomonadaceae bacterium]
MHPLFPDQVEFVSKLREAFRTHQSVLGCAATGFGKTVTSSHITASAVAKKKRTIFTVHRQNLITQTSGEFREFGIPHGFIASGMAYHRDALVHVASIDTLKRRLAQVEVPDLLVVDEAHLGRAKGWHEVIDYFMSRGAKVLGNSATPQRLDGQPLSDLFQTMVEGPPVRWLMDNGRLSDYRYYAPDIPDLSALKKSLGDYNEAQAAEVMDRPKLIGSVVAHYKSLACGKRAVCFAMNVAHSQHLAAEFNLNGVPAAHIDGTTPSTERKRILNDFADGRIRVLCNVELVTTGFDLSAQVGRNVPVECVILCRPTMSLALFLQMVGRALRMKPYPAVILDHAGNSMRHGFPDDPREWSLEGDWEGKGKASDGPPPPITCEGCFRQIRRPAPPECPSCGKRLVAPPKPVEVGEGELIEVTDDMKATMRAQRIKEDREAKTLQELVALGASRGYASPQKWAFQKWSNSRHRQ